MCEIRMITKEKLEKELPHGSGINADWHIEDKGSYFRADNSYNAMNEDGFYIGWQDFYLIIPKKNPDDFRLHFTGDRRILKTTTGYMLRDYLDETFAYAIGEMK